MDRKDQAQDLADKAADQIKNVADKAEGMVSAAGEQIRGAADGASEVAGNVKSAVDKSVKDQPMATLAVVAAVGFVLGALWKS